MLFGAYGQPIMDDIASGLARRGRTLGKENPSRWGLGQGY